MHTHTRNATHACVTQRSDTCVRAVHETREHRMCGYRAMYRHASQYCTGCWSLVPELCTPGAEATSGRTCRRPALICKARPPFELAPGVSDGVCVCARVRACVRACVCMCASCFIIIITHTAPCWPSRRRHYARLGKCKRRPQVGGSSDAGDRACGGPLHLRDIRKRLGACGACVGARYVGGTCAGVGTRHKR